MKAPITIAVIALHLAIVATILVPGCKSSGDSELNPEVTRSQAKSTSHNKASEMARTRAKASAESEIAPQAAAADDSVAIIDSQPQEGSEDFRAAPMRPVATLEDEMFAADMPAPKDSETLAPKSAKKEAAASAEGVQKTYIVQKGDSLSKIASKHGVNLSILMEANGLNRKSVIKVGQKIIIPAAAAQPKAQPAAAQENSGSSEVVTYVVQKGDNLSKIASKYHTSVAAIMELNGMTKSSINAGKTLKIPTGAKAAAAEKKPASAAKKADPKKYEGKLIHEVKSGDTLGGISIKYGVPMKTLMEQNSIKDARKIRIGQILIIKDKPANTEAAFEDKKPEAAPAPAAEAKAPEAAQQPVAAPQPASSDIPADAVNPAPAQPQDIPSL